MFYKKQRTIRKEISINGIGLHTGEFVKMRLIPTSANTGIIFIKDNTEIPARIDFANSFEFSTTLEKDGEKVQTVEHLLSALYMLGIDNLIIKIEGSEVPILDGSSKEFIKSIISVGIKQLKEDKIYAVLNKDVSVEHNGKYIYGQPSNEPIFTFKAKYNNNVIGNRSYSFRPFSQSFFDISNARTYCFFEEIEFLKERGLAKGGSLENAVVFKQDCVLNPDGLRYEDEPVRHKVLDLIGDLYLLGYSIIGDIYSIKGGHFLNAEFVRTLIKEKAFSLVSSRELEKKNFSIKVA